MEQTKKVKFCIAEHNYNAINTTKIAYSIGPMGDTCFTPLVTFPRIILAECNTHRMISKNSASSRAIPAEKMLKMVEDNPFVPYVWQKKHTGMQGKEYYNGTDALGLDIEWYQARNSAVKHSRMLMHGLATKQLSNRLLEPFLWHTALFSATEWENFFKLRCPLYVIKDTLNEGEPYKFRSRKDAKDSLFRGELKCPYTHILDWLKINTSDAEIHISLLAEFLWDLKNESKPKELMGGEWHIPFGDNIDESRILNECGQIQGNLSDEEWVELKKLEIATARCARTSYINFKEKDDYMEDIKLYNHLKNHDPFHASPFEHCQRAMTEEEYFNYSKIHHVSKISPVFEYQISQDPQKIKLRNKKVGGNYIIEEFGWCRNSRGFIQFRDLVERGLM